MRPLLDALARGDRGLLRASTASTFRVDSSNADTKRGLIRDEILPLLRRLHPGRASRTCSRLADERPRLPRELERTLIELARVDATARRPPTSAAASAPCASTTRFALEGACRWGPWTDRVATRAGLDVRARRPGDRLAGRRKKMQDVFVDAKVPRAERDAWPLVVARRRGRRRARDRGRARLGGRRRAGGCET